MKLETGKTTDINQKLGEGKGDASFWDQAGAYL